MVLYAYYKDLNLGTFNLIWFHALNSNCCYEGFLEEAYTLLKIRGL